MYMLQKYNWNTEIAVNGKIIWQDRGASKLSTDTLDAMMRNVMAGFVLQDQEIVDGWRDEHTTHTHLSVLKVDERDTETMEDEDEENTLERHRR